VISNRSTAVALTVGHANGTTTKPFNQTTTGGQWVLHGQYSFVAGTAGYVESTDGGASPLASADAVRFLPVP
jgi:hypothetical protein